VDCAELPQSRVSLKKRARWMWAFVYAQPTDRFTAPHSYAATREDAMQAFASVWFG
jgi:hypothetical protein